LFPLIKFRQRERQVAVADPPEPAVQIIRGPGNQLPGADRALARQDAQELQEQPRRNKLNQIAKSASLSR
jgi:hypothetical protein